MGESLHRSQQCVLMGRLGTNRTQCPTPGHVLTLQSALSPTHPALLFPGTQVRQEENNLDVSEGQENKSPHHCQLPTASPLSHWRKSVDWDLTKSALRISTQTS